MSTGQVSAGYAIGAQAKVRHNYPRTSIKKAKRQEMKLTLKQRFRNWLLDSNQTDESESQGLYVEADRLSTEGLRLQIYKAQGGYVVETRSYDRKTDRNNSTMHVITEESDLGDSLGKIVMMEALRG